MQEPGLEQVRAAKSDGRRENAYAPASETTVPEDFLKALEKKNVSMAGFRCLIEEFASCRCREMLGSRYNERSELLQLRKISSVVAANHIVNYRDVVA